MKHLLGQEVHDTTVRVRVELIAEVERPQVASTHDATLWLTHASWRRDRFERGASIDCHYPGMKAHPKSGVTLLLWSFAENKVTKSFEVNRAATSRGQCTRQRDAKRALADAKAEMAVLGLDFSKRPQPVAHLIESREEKVKEDGREDVRVTHFSHDTAIFTQLYDTVAGISNASVFVEGTKLVILQTSWTNVGKHFFNFYALTPVLELPGPR